MLLMANVQLFLKFRAVEGNTNPAVILHKWFSSASNSLGFAKLAKDSSSLSTIFLYKSWGISIALESGSCVDLFSSACSGPEKSIFKLSFCGYLRVSVQEHLHALLSGDAYHSQDW